VVWEDWDGSQFDVKFSQSIDFGRTWSSPIIVNDNTDRAASDQFQPQVAAGPGGAVAVTSTTAAPPARTIQAFCPSTSGGGTSASTCRCRRSRMGATAPCVERAFIGDYFGLASSKGNVYTLAVSTHYPSDVIADNGGSVYYQ